MSIVKLFKKILLIASFGVLLGNFFMAPAVVMAQAPLGQNLSDAVGFTACNVSGGSGATSSQLQECVTSILDFALAAGALVAIIMFGVEAFQYFNPETSTDTVKKSIEHIKDIFIGLMLIAGPVMILRTFNVALTNFSFLGFTTSQSDATSPNSTSNSNTGTNASTAEDKVGNIALTNDPSKDLNTVLEQAKTANQGGNTSQDFTSALSKILQNATNGTGINPGDFATLNSIFDTLKNANINFNIDPNILGGLISTGKNADGSNTNLANAACYSADCTISGARLTQNPQILTVTLTNKNGNPVDFMIPLNPPNTLPSALSGFLSITPGSNGANSTVRITKPNINSADFNNWCGVAKAANPSNTNPGAAACFKSPASSSSSYYLLGNNSSTAPAPTAAN
jgi:hypothetical protein